MELKLFRVIQFYRVKYHFNRTNMELKLNYPSNQPPLRLYFNRTNMELKLYNVSSIKLSAIILIAPIWN